MNINAEAEPVSTGLLLRNFEIFRALSSAECGNVAKLMRVRTFAPGSYVISETQSHQDVFFIVSGKIRSCAISPGGKQIYYEDLSAGMMFGEFAAIDKRERSADCLAVDESVLVAVTGQRFLEIMDKYPKVKDAVLLRLVQIVRNQMQRVSEFTFFSVNQRVRRELVRMVSTTRSETGSSEESIEVASAPTHTEIALRIGTHREAVTRELRSLQAKGFITWNRGSHIIHDVNALIDYAEK